MSEEKEIMEGDMFISSQCVKADNIVDLKYSIWEWHI